MRQGPQRGMTPADLLLTGVLLLVALAGVVRLVTAPAGARVIVSNGDQILYTASLDTPREVELEGPLGITHLKIEEGGVRIADSPCPLKICMGMGKVSRDGALLACLPNRILVEVVGPPGEEGAYDLLSR